MADSDFAGNFSDGEGSVSIPDSPPASIAGIEHTPDNPVRVQGGAAKKPKRTRKTPQSRIAEAIVYLEDELRAYKSQHHGTLKGIDKALKLLSALVTTGADSPKVARKPNEYNKFVKATMEQLRKEDPAINNNEAMKKCGELWREHKASKA
eukprot:jgi/Chrzof1/8012/UNPLg00063.t1